VICCMLQVLLGLAIVSLASMDVERHKVCQCADSDFPSLDKTA
jgi:hypothetical protein